MIGGIRAIFQFVFCMDSLRGAEDFDVIRCEPQPVRSCVWTFHVGERIWVWSQPEWVLRQIPRRLRVVVPEVVVVEAGFGVVVLAREAERCVRGAVGGPGRRAPEGRAGVP